MRISLGIVIFSAHSVAEGRRRESNRSIRRMPEDIWRIRYFFGNTMAKENQ